MLGVGISAVSPVLTALRPPTVLKLGRHGYIIVYRADDKREDFR